MRGKLADVAIAGGGIIGTSIAWRLARRGVRVVLLEAGTLGGEASTAGAGMLAPGGEYAQDSPWARLAVESLRNYSAFVEELREETGLPIDFRTCGALETARTAEEWEELKRRARAQREFGIETEEAEGSAVFYPDEAVVDPGDVVRALAAACRASGVMVRERTSVRAVRPGPNSVELSLDSGAMEAGFAVLAAGAWAGSIPVEGASIPATFPVKGQLAGFRLPAGVLGPILRRGHTYLFQRSSGFTVAGSTSQPGVFDRSVDPALTLDIAERAQKLAPGLPLGAPVRSWAGFRPGVEGGEPQVRRLEGTKVWLAYGHCRNGILLAPATARLVERGILAAEATAPGSR